MVCFLERLRPTVSREPLVQPAATVSLEPGARQAEVETESRASVDWPTVSVYVAKEQARAREVTSSVAVEQRQPQVIVLEHTASVALVPWLLQTQVTTAA